jgi:transposase
MFYIGIDVAKLTHYAAVIDSNGEAVLKPFEFANDTEGFELFRTNCLNFLKTDNHLIGLEDTGHYGDNLVKWLLDQDYKVALINPVTTSHMRKIQLKTSKNDRIDSVLIASVLTYKPIKYRLIGKSNFEFREIRHLTRMHHNLKEQLNVFKNRLQSRIDILFPEYNELFKSKYGVHYLEILENMPSAHFIARTDIRTIRKIMSIKGSGVRCSFTAQQLKNKAKKYIGEDNPILEMEVRHLVSLIRLMNSQIAEIDSKIREFSHQLNSPILDIPGISHFSCMSIISEIGNINSFSSPSKLIRFAGVDPYDYQSGLYKANTTSINKLGSRYLRKTLYQIIIPVIRFNPVFQQYYTRKIQQGKSHRCACGHCVRKLLRIIYHLLFSNVSFDSSKMI